MDLSCEENMQHSSNTGRGRRGRVDMCVAGPDRALDNDPRVLPNLLTLEKANSLNEDYFQSLQTDIQPYMRKVVTTWMLEVCEEQHCEEQVFPLAVTYLDQFLSQRAISRQQLQLLAVTCMLLASKFRQCHPLTVDLLCAYTDNSVVAQEVRQWEVIVLQRLNWQLSMTTSFDFVEPFLARVPWGRSNPLIRAHALTLTSICYTDSSFLLVPGSLIAAACIAAAARGLRVEMSIDELCTLIRAVPKAAELVARHVERVLARETQPQEPRTRLLQPYKQTAPEQKQFTTTPTDVQDVRF